MTRPIRLAAAVLATAAVTCLAASSNPASSLTDPSGSGVAHSQGALAGVATLTPKLTIGNACVFAVCLPTSTLSGLVNTVVSPLLTALQGLPNSLVNGLIASGLMADQSDTQVDRPSPAFDPSTGVPNFPTCGVQAWDASGAGNCYSATNVPVSLSSLLGLSVGAVRGYATDDSAGYIGAAEGANIGVSLLGTSVGSLGTADSSASCPNTTGAACTPTQKLSGVSLLGGTLKASIANGTTVATLNGSPLLPNNTTAVSVGGLSVLPQLNGNLLTLAVTLSSAQLASALGVPLPTGTTGVTASLTLVVGPGTTTGSSGSATAWGVEVGADLSLTINLGVSVSVLGLGLVNVPVSITAGGNTASPDLLDLKLAYSSAMSGGARASWIPAGAI